MRFQAMIDKREEADSQSTVQTPFLGASGLALFYHLTGRQGFAPLDLSIDMGAFVSIVGPSGCGKSSLLKTLAGLLSPTQGRLEWQFSQKEQAFIFQDPTLLPWLTVRGNVELPLRLKGVPAKTRRKKADEVIEQVLLGAAAENYPKDLSGGMRMRVSMARAMIIQPNILFLDEPFAALDAITRNQMNQLLHNLHLEHGWTTVMVTHSVHEAVLLSDVVHVMADHPQTIVTHHTIDLPRIRSLDLQTTDAYTRQVADVRLSLERGGQL
jgi:NitT/TauT family transport system ATP-binding protein